MLAHLSQIILIQNQEPRIANNVLSSLFHSIVYLGEEDGKDNFLNLINYPKKY